MGLYFHALEPQQWSSFSECIQFCRDQGYEFVDARGLFESEAPRKVFLSFDDNYRSWYSALELFERLDVSVTFYVNTLPFRDGANQEEIEDYFDRIAHFGERVPLSTGELREIAAAGHRIGCHGHSHFNLAQVPASDRAVEIDRSKAILEDILGEAVPDFSYPFGMRRFFSEELRAYCLALGFETVANAIPAMQYQPQRVEAICRSSWDLSQSLNYNLTNLRIDGRIFERLTGRSPVI